MDTDILKPNMGYQTIERPSHVSSSKGSSDPQSSGVLTPEADLAANMYTEPVSDGEEDEDMDIGPAKDEGKRTGLTAGDVAEAIAYREKMLNQSKVDLAQSYQSRKSILKGKTSELGSDGDDIEEVEPTQGDERKPYLRSKPALAPTTKEPRGISIDPLAPSSAFDRTLRERLQGTKIRADGQDSANGTTAVNGGDENNQEEGTSYPRGDDRVLVRDFKAPAGKRVSVPVRIEPKVYFAAERTFLVRSMAYHLTFIANILSRNGSILPSLSA